MTDWKVIEGDCVEAMAAMDTASVDAVVCDPPYGLEFMAKEWDRLIGPNWKDRPKGGTDPFDRPRPRFGTSPKAMQDWHQRWAQQALRVLKPGGHLLAFGGTRTYHRLACAIEDAGFEIRDTIAWMYGSGFPKSLDVSAAIDEAAGATREVVGPSARHVSGKPEQRTEGLVGSSTFAESIGMGAHITAPATPDAERWQGWGTALKPAHEPIVVARKPLDGTVAATVLRHGTGALNVDGCRIAGDPWTFTHSDKTSRSAGIMGDTSAAREGVAESNPAGRWPANVVLDESWEPVARLRDTLDSDAWDLLEAWCCARNGGVREVRAAVRRAAEPGESAAVLFARVPGGVDERESPRRGAPDERQEALAGSAGEDERGGAAQREARGGQSQLEGSLPLAGLRDGEPTGRAGDPGAPAGHGRGARASAGAERGGAPSQRREDGQPPGESRGALAGVAHAGARGALPGVAATARARVEVLVRDVPAEWLRYFEDTGDVVRCGAAAMLDEQTGTLTSGQLAPHHRRNGDRLGMSAYGHDPGDPASASAGGTFGGDSGGASRFFYCAKSSSAERNAGLDGFEAVSGAERSGRQEGSVGLGARGPGAGGGANPYAGTTGDAERRNGHPTVKPIALMRWLVRLVTPPGGLVLDPFAGSGTTGCAAALEGFRFVGIEREPEYAAIARARIQWWSRHPDGMELVQRLEHEKKRTAIAESGQTSIFDLNGTG